MPDPYLTVGTTFFVGPTQHNDGVTRDLFLIVTKDTSSPNWSFGSEVEVCWGYHGFANKHYLFEWGELGVGNVKKLLTIEQFELNKHPRAESLTSDEIADMIHTYKVVHDAY